MDSLLAEINSKRKALTELDGGGEPSKKYMRRADIERAKEEEDARKRAEAKAAEEAKSESSRAAKMRREAESARKASLQRLGSPSSSSNTGTPEPSGSGAGETFNISNDEAIRRLRSKGQPIRLFGETDKERRLRLRALELLEKTTGSSSQGFNDFNKLMKDMESGYEAKEEDKRSRAMHLLATAREREGSGTPGAGAGEKGGADEKREREEQRRKVADQVLDLGLIKSDPQKIYPIMYYVLKGVLKEWEEWMEARPEDVKRSTQGRLALGTQIASGQNLKPLFKQIRARDMENDVLRSMSEIVHYMQTRQYQKANDAYLRLSIGNAAWPIGVTSVGIHERSAREKIHQDVVGHVLNDEVSRKWIQAVKRLLTFSQTIRPPYDLSQMMG